ncbi:hypothetical protein T11_62 [Trichinella zimbabwensis]|uniref:Uncharacterized protein n=1 Tax=Trichinella zimbabwensis TaxID=268475 RepID=A0A0V1GXX1_9BILA|nr:hypothetical protein T11_62 [Trichinella zimbabwensis]
MKVKNYFDTDLQNWDPWGTAYTVCLHSTVLLRVVLDLLRVVLDLLRAGLGMLRKGASNS